MKFIYDEKVPEAVPVIWVSGIRFRRGFFGLFLDYPLSSISDNFWSWVDRKLSGWPI